MDLNSLRDRAYKIACEHGFHDKEHSDEHLLMLVITELSEAVNADRKNKHADIEKYMNRIEHSRICQGLDEEIPKERGYEVSFERFIKDSVEDEISDAVIRLLDLAGLRGIELGTVPFRDRYCKKLPEFCYHACEALTCYGIFLDLKINCSINNIIWWCSRNNIDIEWHIEQKMRYNELRPYKHGKEY